MRWTENWWQRRNERNDGPEGLVAGRADKERDMRMDGNLPKDPVMLLSFINTQLRDKFVDLESLCDYYGIDVEWLKKTLAAVDYEYDAEQNRFM